MDPASVALYVVTAAGLAFGAGFTVDKRKGLRFTARAADGVADGAIGSIEGEVVAIVPLLRSPVTGTPCVYWQLSFDEVGACDWVERARLQEDGEFFVDAPAGRARVIAHGARIDVPPHHVERRAGYGEPVAGYDLVLAQARAAGVRFARGSSLLRVTEWIVKPGTSIRVEGGCKLEPDPGAVADVEGYRAALPTRPVLSGTRRAPLLIATRR